ncbi:hypothetical protein BLOT_000620 [Blomia tropicalis]|nr:hypothetical protein BLOT_000620 [Blomia tropicalis]
MTQPISADIFDEENLSVVLYGKEDIRLEKWPFPTELKPNECLLKSHSTGICGTDIHLWRNATIADFVADRPYVLGHEPSATVMAVGKAVKHLKEGDRVAIEPAIPCLHCELCRKGRYNLCPESNKQSHGLPCCDGSLRRYYTHRADFCFKLPENVSLEEGAMVEALAVVVHACRRVHVHIGQSVLVCGAGPVGIMTMLCARAFGASKVFITDIQESRLALAKKLGADGTYHIDIKKPFVDRKIAAEIVELMGNRPDVSIECSGVASSQSMAIHATKSGGKVAIVGLGSPMNSVPLSSAAMREVDLIGVCRIKDDYPLAIRLIATGKIDVKPLITQRYPIKKALEGFQILRNPGDQSVVKVLIQYDD